MLTCCWLRYGEDKVENSSGTHTHVHVLLDLMMQMGLLRFHFLPAFLPALA